MKSLDTIYCFLLSKLKKGIFDSLKFFKHILIFFYFVDRHILFENSTGCSNLFGCCAFITSKHPDFDISLHEILYTALNIVLKKIFNSSYTQKFVVVFNLTKFLIMSSFIFHLFLIEHLHSKHQCPETL